MKKVRFETHLLTERGNLVGDDFQLLEHFIPAGNKVFAVQGLLEVGKPLGKCRRLAERGREDVFNCSGLLGCAGGLERDEGIGGRRSYDFSGGGRVGTA